MRTIAEARILASEPDNQTAPNAVLGCDADNDSSPISSRRLRPWASVLADLIIADVLSYSGRLASALSEGAQP